MLQLRPEAAQQINIFKKTAIKYRTNGKSEMNPQKKKKKGTVLGKETTVQRLRSDTNVLTSAVWGKVIWE